MGVFSRQSGFANEEDLAIEESMEVEPVVQQMEVEVQEANQRYEAEVQRQTEVQRRMRKAQWYNTLLENPLFGPNNDPLATEVEDEVRAFVNEQLEIFLGMRGASKKGVAGEDFDEQQIDILRMMANRMLKRPLTAGIQVQREEPSAPTMAPRPTAPRIQSPMPAPAPQALPPPRAAAPRVAARPQRKPQQETDATRMVQHPLTGKMVPSSSIQQTQPQGIKPADMPVDGNFAGQPTAQGGGFVDMTGGRAGGATQMATQGASQGSVGGGIQDTAVHQQLIHHFLTK